LLLDAELLRALARDLDLLSLPVPDALFEPFLISLFEL